LSRIERPEDLQRVVDVEVDDAFRRVSRRLAHTLRARAVRIRIVIGQDPHRLWMLTHDPIRDPPHSLPHPVNRKDAQLAATCIPDQHRSDGKALVARGEGSWAGRLARLHVAHQSSRLSLDALDQARSHPPRRGGGQGRDDELVKLGWAPHVKHRADWIGVPGMGLHIQSRLTQLVGKLLGSALRIGRIAQRHDEGE
jgi:hypothetical protein